MPSLSPLLSFRFAVLLALALGAAGCSSIPAPEGLQPQGDTLAKAVPAVPGRHPATVALETVTMPPPAPEDLDPHFRLGPGDRVVINVFGEVGLTDVPVTLDADGIVQLPIVERVKLSGLTTVEAQKKIKRLFSKDFVNPWVTVQLADAKSRPVYLLGQFNQPGVIYMAGPMNVIEAMGHGRGLTEGAHLRGARLIRAETVVPVDINALLNGGRFDQNVQLRPNDTIYVPATTDLRVFVLGAVAGPGPLAIGNTRLTLMEALTSAGGPRRAEAVLEDVRIIRSLSPVAGEFITVNVTRILAGEVPDYPLEPGDIVFVPQNRLADWNDVIAGIAPTVQLVSGVLDPIVTYRALTNTN